MFFPHYRSVWAFRLGWIEWNDLSTLLDLEETPSVSGAVRVWLHETVPTYTKGPGSTGTLTAFTLYWTTLHQYIATLKVSAQCPDGKTDAA